MGLTESEITLGDFFKPHMKKLLFIVLIVQVCLSIRLSAQSYTQTYQQATFLMSDSSSSLVEVNVKLLLVKNILDFKTQPSKPFTLKDAYAVVIDSTKYFIKKIENISDTVKVVERLIEGRISLYRSPRITTKAELFAEKDHKTYELRQIKKLMEEGTFWVKEYASFLKILTLDCAQIEHQKLENVKLSLAAISKIVSLYNSNCGWQKSFETKEELKPQITIGLVAGFSKINNDLRYHPYSGRSSLTGFYAGPSISIEFRKFYDTRITYDLLVESLSGEGRASHQAAPNNPGYDHIHNYSIVALNHIIAFNIAVFRNKDIDTYLGAGSIVQHQIRANNPWTTAVNPGPRPDALMYESNKDRINLAPVAHAYIGFKSIGVRYQVAPLSIQMKKIERYGFGHRLSVHYSFSW